VFHYLTVMTLAQWQVPPAAALAAAIVLHAVSIGPKLLLAPFALIDRPERPERPERPDRPARA
jgi:hypothetical protein